MKASRLNLTVHELKKNLTYDPLTGNFIRNKSNHPKIKIGDIAGCQIKSGYILVTVNSVQYLAHRLAWLYQTGNWPQEEIDHANGIKCDNRFSNLRESTRHQNMKNIKNYSTSSSGIKNVVFNKRSNKFVVAMRSDGKRYHVGYFKKISDAKKAAIDFRKKLHKEFSVDMRVYK